MKNNSIFFWLINFSGLSVGFTAWCCLQRCWTSQTLEWLVSNWGRYFIQVPTNEKKQYLGAQQPQMLGKSREGKWHVWISRQSISVMPSTVSSYKRILPQRNTWSRHSFWVYIKKHLDKSQVHLANTSTSDWAGTGEICWLAAQAVGARFLTSASTLWVMIETKGTNLSFTCLHCVSILKNFVQYI